MAGESLTSSNEESVELAVRSLLVPALENASQRLDSLHDSQVALLSQLEFLRAKLDSYREDTEPPELRDTVMKIYQTRKRLSSIVITMKEVEGRLLRIKQNMSGRQI